jgi:hypothetical protein
MNAVNKLFTLASLPLLATGCAGRTNAPEAKAADSASLDSAAGTQEKARAKMRKAAPEKRAHGAGERIPARKVGDYFIYRYSGSFTEQPVTLTEQVVAIEDGLVVVDFILEEGAQMNALRVRVRPDDDESIVSVSRIGGEQEIPATIADYEALIKKTQLVADSNDEVVGSNVTTCLVGTKELDCEVTTYLVSMGQKQAMLTVSRSEDLPIGRDVGGEIVGPDGSLIYSARLIDSGNEKPAADALLRSNGASARFRPEGP